MVKITFTKPDDNDLVFSPSSLFSIVYQEEWFKDELVLKIIKNIDKCTYVSDSVFIHEEYGAITANDLSTGTKTLILTFKYKEHKIYQLSNLGDNCYVYLEEMFKNKDVIFYGNCVIPHNAPQEFNFYIIESNKLVRNIFEYIEEYINYD